jgi:signal recognition particle receptor subunit beta
MWNDLAVGALGGVVLVDTRRLESSFAAIDFFEKRGIPFVAAVNCFEGRQRYSDEQIRSALALDSTLPVHMFDARDPGACRDVLLTLVDHVLATVSASSGPLPTVR